MTEEIIHETILSITLDRLDNPLTHHTPGSEAFRHIIFPNLQSAQFFQQNRDLLTLRVIQYLNKYKSPSVEYITLPLDFSNIGNIFRCLSSFSSLHEIELLHPTTFNLDPYTKETSQIQEALSASMGHFNHLKKFEIPLEVLSPSLLLDLGKLPNLQTLIVKPRPSPYPIQAPSAWSPPDPTTFPGRRFLNLFQKLDIDRYLMDGYFQTLKFLDVGVGDHDDLVSEGMLAKLFPGAMIL